MLTQFLCSEKETDQGRSRAPVDLKWSSLTVVNGFQPFTIIIKSSILDIEVVLHPPLLMIDLCWQYIIAENLVFYNFSLLGFWEKKVFQNKKTFRKSETALFEQTFSKIIREKRAQKSNSKSLWQQFFKRTISWEQFFKNLQFYKLQHYKVTNITPLM